jgi:hypothetical protein
VFARRPLDFFSAKTKKSSKTPKIAKNRRADDFFFREVKNRRREYDETSRH